MVNSVAAVVAPAAVAGGAIAVDEVPQAV